MEHSTQIMAIYKSVIESPAFFKKLKEEGRPGIPDKALIVPEENEAIDQAITIYSDGYCGLSEEEKEIESKKLKAKLQKRI